MICLLYVLPISISIFPVGCNEDERTFEVFLKNKLNTNVGDTRGNRAIEPFTRKKFFALVIGGLVILLPLPREKP
jgi:hypothetical protein